MIDGDAYRYSFGLHARYASGSLIGDAVRANVTVHPLRLRDGHADALCVEPIIAAITSDMKTSRRRSEKCEGQVQRDEERGNAETGASANDQSVSGYIPDHEERSVVRLMTQAV